MAGDENATSTRYAEKDDNPFFNFINKTKKTNEYLELLFSMSDLKKFEPVLKGAGHVFKVGQIVDDIYKITDMIYDDHEKYSEERFKKEKEAVLAAVDLMLLPLPPVVSAIASEVMEYSINNELPPGDILMFDPPEQLTAVNPESGEQNLSDSDKSVYGDIFDSPVAVEGGSFPSWPVGEVTQKVIGYADEVINGELIEAAKAGTVPENLIVKGLTGIGAKGLSVAGDTYKILSADDKVKASAEVVGEHVGNKAGMAVGAAIGTAIFPGVGSAIGGAIGYFGGGYLGEKAGGFAVDFFRNPDDYLPNYDPDPLWTGGPDQSVNMEELLNEEIFRSTLPPESDQGNQYTDQEVNNQNVTVNIAVEGQGDENGIVNKLVARLGEVFENMNTSGCGIV